MVWKLADTLIFLKGCHQPRIGRGKIDFKESWLIGCRDGTLGHFFHLYWQRSRISAFSNRHEHIRIENTTQKSFFFPSYFDFAHFSFPGVFKALPSFLFFPSLLPLFLSSHPTQHVINCQDPCLFAFYIFLKK